MQIFDGRSDLRAIMNAAYEADDSKVVLKTAADEVCDEPSDALPDTTARSVSALFSPVALKYIVALDPRVFVASDEKAIIAEVAKRLSLSESEAELMLPVVKWFTQNVNEDLLENGVVLIPSKSEFEALKPKYLEMALSLINGTAKYIDTVKSGCAHFNLMLEDLQDAGFLSEPQTELLAELFVQTPKLMQGELLSISLDLDFFDKLKKIRTLSMLFLGTVKFRDMAVIAKMNGVLGPVHFKSLSKMLFGFVAGDDERLTAGFKEVLSLEHVTQSAVSQNALLGLFRQEVADLLGVNSPADLNGLDFSWFDVESEQLFGNYSNLWDWTRVAGLPQESVRRIEVLREQLIAIKESDPVRYDSILKLLKLLDGGTVFDKTVHSELTQNAPNCRKIVPVVGFFIMPPLTDCEVDVKSSDDGFVTVWGDDSASPEIIPFLEDHIEKFVGDVKRADLIGLVDRVKEIAVESANSTEVNELLEKTNAILGFLQGQDFLEQFRMVHEPICPLIPFSNKFGFMNINTLDFSYALKINMKNFERVRELAIAGRFGFGKCSAGRHRFGFNPKERQAQRPIIN